MSIQFRLTVMNFMQFFVWGSWLISLGAYMIDTLGFTGGQVGSIFATMGIGSLIMRHPADAAHRLFADSRKPCGTRRRKS